MTEKGQSGTWRERLQKWNELLAKDKLLEQLESSNAKYAVEFDMKEVENSLRRDVINKAADNNGVRALWIAKRWWRYRPKLPYTYFLQKLDCSEVKRCFLCWLYFLLCKKFNTNSQKVVMLSKTGG